MVLTEATPFPDPIKIISSNSFKELTGNIFFYNLFNFRSKKFISDTFIKFIYW
jgi:hypothetical protein